MKRARANHNVVHEAHVLKTCAHPHVVHCFGVNEDSTELWLEKGELDLYDHVADMEHCELHPEEVHPNQCICVIVKSHG